MSEQLKIALVGPTPPPSGGIAVHLQTLGAALRAGGHEVETIDPGRMGSPVELARALASAVARGFVLHVHTNGHNARSWAVAAAAGLARTPRRGNLITLHSGLLPGYLEGLPSRQQAARLALAPYGRVVAVSRPVGDALIASGVAPSRIVELPAFLPRAVRPGELPERVITARDRHDLLLCAALAPSPVYGARVLWPALVQIAQTEPGAGLVVFGPGTAELQDELDAAGVRDRVYALGELEHAEALATMAVCDAFVRPTLADGDAISVREALALGVRVVASDVAARPLGTRTFRAGDPFALADAIRGALELPPPAVVLQDPMPRLIEMYRELSEMDRPRRAHRPAPARRQLGFAPGF